MTATYSVVPTHSAKAGVLRRAALPGRPAPNELSAKDLVTALAEEIPSFQVMSKQMT
jgi:hypothetical protein